MIEDESHLPVSEQSLVFRLLKRAEIRRQIPGRLAVIEGKPDKIANLLEEAATKIMHQTQHIESLEQQLSDMRWELYPDRSGQ